MKRILPLAVFALIASSCGGKPGFPGEYARLGADGQVRIVFSAYEREAAFGHKSIGELLSAIPESDWPRVKSVKIEDPGLRFDIAFIYKFKNIEELFLSVGEIAGGLADLEKCAGLKRLELSPLRDGAIDLRALGALENVTLGKMASLAPLERLPTSVKSVNGSYDASALGALEARDRIEALMRAYPGVVFTVVPDGVAMDAGE